MPAADNPSLRDWNQWMLSVAAGALITAAALLMIVYAVMWLTPKLLSFSQSRWGYLLPAISILIVCVGGMVRRLRARPKLRPNPTRE
ncbi:MAG: hypothetical protein ACRD51_11875 [Candidatus Acidiferrum sp.]